MRGDVLLRSAIIIATTFALASPIGAQSAHELFQQALSKERAEGNLPEAIKLYQRVVDTASIDHALAAKALLQLGRCYEQLGNTEARTAYERLIARYPDQTELVAQAKSRLASLVRPPPASTPGAITVRPLPDVGAMTLAVSRDATKAIIWDLSKGQNLALHDFSNKQRRLLTDLDWSMGLINFPVWSPDERRVAYQQNNYQRGKDVTSELRVTTLDGRSSVAYRVDLYGGVQPVGWTPDGTSLIVVIARPDRTWTVGTLPAAGGQFTPLRSFGWSYDAGDGSPRVSPDGRFVAYLEGERGVRDIHVVSLDGRQAYRVTTDPADDFAPIWSPDGRRLAFKSNRLGSVSMWTVEIKDGQPTGQPVKLKDGMQAAQLIDWTAKGIVYLESWRSSDLFTVPMDPAQGRATGPARPISYWRTGRNVNPVWSPDGRRLAFVSSAAAEPNRRFVVVLPLDAGQAREFLIPTTSWQNLQAPYDLHWFGDGRGLGFSGHDTRGDPTVFRLLLDTGEWHTIPSIGRYQTRTEWNHDGSAFYFARSTLGKGEADGGIFERAVNGDTERLVYRAAPGGAIQSLQFSADRKWLAFRHSRFEGDTGTLAVLAVDVATGEARTVVVEPIAVEVNLLGWTPSGDLLVHKIFGTLPEKLAGGTSEILRVPLNGGPSRPFAIPSIGPTPPGETSRQIVAKWSPDGQTMVIGRAGRGGETFVIENPLAAVRPTTTGRR
jgi:Tol biopolymer transport system component